MVASLVCTSTGECVQSVRRPSLLTPGGRLPASGSQTADVSQETPSAGRGGRNCIRMGCVFSTAWAKGLAAQYPGGQQPAANAMPMGATGRSRAKDFCLFIRLLHLLGCGRLSCAQVLACLDSLWPQLTLHQGICSWPKIRDFSHHAPCKLVHSP